MNINEFCEYMGIGKTKARELLNNPKNRFTVRIGNRLYANKKLLDEWLEYQCKRT
ncbi:MAG: excisionase [Clostridiales bacterium]|nr:excisionase [Clostridiales bacterium]